jgi:hypothetical protein
MMQKLCYIALIILISACQKAPQRRCWKSAGNIVWQNATLSFFSYLHLHPHIELTIVQDSLNYIEWQAGEHLQPFLKATIESDTLQLYNLNRCRFLRYKNGNVKAIVHFTSLKELHLDNSESVSSIGAWAQDELVLHLKEGVGPVNLQLFANKAMIRNHYGWQKLNLSGVVKSLFVDLDGSAALNTLDLTVQDSISFRSAAHLSSSISANLVRLKAQLYGEGNLYYAGAPSVLWKTEYGNGRVLPK